MKKFYDGLNVGTFFGRKCPECAKIEIPPYPACNACGHIGGSWVDITNEEVTVNEIYKITPIKSGIRSILVNVAE